uniref:DEP domain-containing protein n=2 Tax=Eutreptiella gymnastica TaxID=73025 RepID=A0A7S4GKW7_9EUGL
MSAQQQFLIQGVHYPLGQLLKRFLQPRDAGGLAINDRWFGIRRERDCFTGQHFVDWLIEEFAIPGREEALKVAQSLVDHEVLHAITSPTPHNFEDNDQCYRLQAQEKTGALNTMQIWKQKADPPMIITARLAQMLAEAVALFRDEEGKVDYAALHESDAFRDFQLATCELQAVDFKNMAPDMRKAFCFNIYNILVVHAYGEVGVPKSILGFYNQIRYQIQGQQYSCDDIENGVLRANRKPVVALGPLFGPRDPRLACVMPEVDQRLHFALNCGASSCPAVKYYTAENVDDELTLAAQGFCEQDGNVLVDEDKRILYLSKIFAWYSIDFGSNDLEIANSVLQYLRGSRREQLQQLLNSGSFQIKSLPYDWSNDANTSPPRRLSMKLL